MNPKEISRINEIIHANTQVNSETDIVGKNIIRDIEEEFGSKVKHKPTLAIHKFIGHSSGIH